MSGKAVSACMQSVKFITGMLLFLAHMTMELLLVQPLQRLLRMQLAVAQQHTIISAESSQERQFVPACRASISSYDHFFMVQMPAALW